MKIQINIRRKQITIPLLCLSLILAACTPSERVVKDGQITVGPSMGVDTPQGFSLLENKDALAADGLYYATWGIGNSSPYKNSDGETVELYEAQLYLLTKEAKDGESAKKSYLEWLESAEGIYDVLNKETITCNGQPYILLTYNCIGADTPYSHGVSAFGVYGANAVCAELTCVEEFQEGLAPLLTNFLNNCYYE